MADGVLRSPLLWAAVAAVLAVLAANVVDLERATVRLGEDRYDVEDVTAPRLVGAVLAAFARVMHVAPLGTVLARFLMADNKFYLIQRLAAQIDSPPVVMPLRPPTPAQRTLHEQLAAQHPTADVLARLGNVPGAPQFRLRSSREYVAAYTSGRTTPYDVAQALISAVKRSNAASPPLRAVVALNETDLLRQAEASRLRYNQQRPLSALDGVPIFVKDEFRVLGYETTVGTRFLGGLHGPVTSLEHEATAVRRLREAGALIAGKTNMHEIGIGTTGHNPHFLVPRNPHNPAHYTSGSSSGSGAAVAAGLVPIAVGADGGGSVRLPAAASGVVGLKATYGRISDHNAFPLAWSVAHAGPIAASVYDTALAYSIMAGPDAHDRMTLEQPPVHLATVEQVADLRGVRVGVYRAWNEHADTDVVAATATALAGLQARGADVVEFTFPNLSVLNLAHTLTILSEMAASMAPYMRNHTHDFAHDTQINLALAQAITASEYVAAQRVRSHFMDQLERVFVANKLDAVVTPSSGMTIPAIPLDAVAAGESNLSVTARIMRFAQMGNFLGVPAISVPFGFSNVTSTDPALPLPIGVQVMAAHWNEHVVLRLAFALEQIHAEGAKRVPSTAPTLTFGPRKPTVHYDLLTLA